MTDKTVFAFATLLCRLFLTSVSTNIKLTGIFLRLLSSFDHDQSITTRLKGSFSADTFSPSVLQNICLELFCLQLLHCTAVFSQA